MTAGTVGLQVRSDQTSAAVIDITGELTAASEPELMAAYTRAGEANHRAIVLNFAGLEYMNSTGIGLLVTLLVRARRQHQQLLACGLSDHYRQILELTRIDEAIAVYDSEADALAGAAGDVVTGRAT